MNLNSKSNIHITGGLGFIGSNLVRYLNKNYGIRPIIYDKLDSVGDKWKYVSDLDCEIRDWTDSRLINYTKGILVHLGANVDTTESFSRKLWDNNVVLSLLWFSRFDRVIYASSAAVYGAEEQDFRERVEGLTPLNAYAFTKLSLDREVMVRNMNAVGLRLFNIYGPNEGHKGTMSSVIYQALYPKDVNQSPPNILTKMTRDLRWDNYYCADLHWSLFESARADMAHGEQKRDFTHVDDVCSVICYFLEQDSQSSQIYNVGTGNARSYNELVRIINPDLPVRYRPMPTNLEKQYQYRTCADLTKLHAVGYNKPFLSLEEGIAKVRASNSVGLIRT